MNSPKYLNGVLTVIAVCLVILTMSVIGVFPKANAAPANTRYLTVPVNADGTVSVKVLGGTDVNIVQVAGQTVQPRGGISSPGSLPTRSAQ